MRLALFLPLIVLVACGDGSDNNSGQAAASATASPSTLSSRVDALFADFDTLDGPGCAVGVMRNRAFAHARGYGSANLEYDIPIDRKTVFRTGSVSKQFAAHAIAILAVRGEIDLDADVHTYLPDLREYAYPVTVRQMVHHLSGIDEYDGGNPLYEVRPGELFRFGNEHYWTIEEFYEAIRTKPLSRKPGEQWEYSNTAYFLLSQIVERVTGKSLRQFSDEEVFKPLQMHDTFFYDDTTEPVKRRADGYKVLDDGRYAISMTRLDWVGDGAIYTTLDDWLKWDNAFWDGTLPGGEEVMKLMITPDPITTQTHWSDLMDEGAGYAFGLIVGTYRGHRAQVHYGGFVGFVAFHARFPDHNFGVVALCNRTDAWKNERVERLLDIGLSEFAGVESEYPQAAAIDR